MQTILVVLTAIFLGLVGLARPFVNCSAPPGANLDIRTEDQVKMSNSISTLQLRNLSDVFGENDPVRREVSSRIDEAGAAYHLTAESGGQIACPAAYAQPISSTRVDGSSLAAVANSAVLRMPRVWNWSRGAS